MYMITLFVATLLLGVALARSNKVFVQHVYSHKQPANVITKTHPQRWMKHSNLNQTYHAYRTNDPSAPVGGDIWPVSIFWSFVEIGTPAEKFPVAIDSGSFTLDIPLYKCKGCITKEPNNEYLPPKSSTSRPLKCDLECAFDCHDGQCGFSNTYETCSPTNPTESCTISGLWYEDSLKWAGSGSTTAEFGAINYQTTNFYQFYTIDGVIGMAGSAESKQSVLAQLAKSGAIAEDVWSLCLRNPVVKPVSKSNGTIVLGGVDERLLASGSSIQYTQNAGFEGFYEMNINSVEVGTSKIDSPSTVIIDSGTNDLLLTDGGYQSFKSVLTNYCGTSKLRGICDVPAGQTLFDGYCYSMTEAEVNAYPTIKFDIESITPALEMSGSDYLLEGFGSVPFQANGTLCLAVGSAGGQFIVGDNLLHNYYVVFDRVRSRIGWGKVNSTNCGDLDF